MFSCLDCGVVLGYLCLIGKFDQVLQIVIKIFENCDGVVGCFFGWVCEFYFFGCVVVMIVLEIIGVQEQEYLVVGLVVDIGCLMVV